MTSSNTLLGRALKSAGGEREFRRKTKLYSDSLDFFESHREELLQNYNEHWVAILGSEIVGYDKSLKGLIYKLGKANMNVEEVLIEFLSAKQMITLF